MFPLDAQRDPWEPDAPALKESGREEDRAAEGERSVEELRRGSLRAYLRLLGPGLTSGGSDDDPSAIATFTQAGSGFGFGLLWTALFTFPLMAAVQEACARIALQTGVGLGASLRRRFPVWLVGILVVGLAVSNLITLSADLGAVAAGLALLARGRVDPLWLVIPVAAALLALQFRATFEVIFNVFKWLTLSLFAYVIAGVLAHPDGLAVLRATVVPHLDRTPQFLLTLAAVFGTAFSPYIFFWQGSMEITELEVRGRRSEAQRRDVDDRYIHAARADVFTGMFFAQLVMYFVILTTGAVLHTHGVTGVSSAEQAARALQPVAGPGAFLLFSLGFVGAGMLAVPVLAASTAYAVKECMGFGGSLEVKPRAAPRFYAIIVVAMVIGAGLNALHVDLIQALVVASAVSGAVAAPLIIAITVLGGDRRMMGERTSGRLSRTLTWTAGVLMTAIAAAWIVSPILH